MSTTGIGEERGQGPAQPHSRAGSRELMGPPPVRFVPSADGTRIAWSVHGHGYPLVRVSTIMTHLMLDWEAPFWRHWHEDLGARFTYIRYDDRGCGMSDRNPTELSMEAWLADMDAVIGATGFERVALLGASHAAALAVAYAARFPERVSHIVTLGGYPSGSEAGDAPQDVIDRSRAFNESVRVLWDRPDEFFRRMWALELMPEGTPEEVSKLETLMAQSTSGEMAARIFAARDRLDVREVAGSVATPALIAHGKHDRVVPFEASVELARLLPNATLVGLDTSNHVPLREPAWTRFLSELTSFIGVGAEPVTSSTPLTDRELEILGLVAEGSSNRDIGEQLALSTRTVERHLSNIYRKLGVTGRSARAAAAGRFQSLRSPT